MKNFLNSILPPPSNFYAKIGKLGRFMFLVVFTICCTSSLLTAQSKIWLHGNKIVNLSDSYNITVENLIPDNPPADIDYDNAIPTLSEHIEYDANGNILFFMIDGKIYNKDGYLMVEKTDLEGSLYEYYPEKMLTYSIIKVPKTCDKYYIFSNLPSYIPVDNVDPTMNFFVGIIDLSATNIFYPNDPDKKGALINWNVQQNNSIDLLNIANSNNAQALSIANLNCGVVVSIDTEIPGNPSANKMTLTQFTSSWIDAETVFLNTALFGSSHNWKLKNSGIEFLSENECTVSENNVSHYYENRCIGINSNSELILAKGRRTGGTSYASILDQNLMDIECLTSIFLNNVITSEISSDGRIYAAFSYSGNLSYVDISSDPSVTLNFNNIQNIANLNYWLSGCHFRRNVFEGQESIFVFHSDGIDVIKGINNPTTATLISNAIDLPSPTSTNAIVGEALGLFNNENYCLQAANFTGASNLVIAPIQVYNRMDEIVSSSACCVFETNYNAEGNITINSNQTWSPGNNPFNNTLGPIHFTGTITIPSGKLLQINQGLEIRFDENASVQVLAGGKLTINNAKLTSYACEGKMWPGIDVYGPGNISNIPQSVIIGGACGIVEMQNDAIIENAIIAIEVGKNNNNAGGVARVLSGKFINNETGVKFYQYSYQNGGSIVPNKSFIQLASFETTDELANPALWPKSHIEMNGIVKLKIRNCNFKNTTPITSETEWLKRGTGIRSFNSSFGCSGIAANDDSFYHLTNGIVQLNFGSPIASFVCTGMHFNGCMSGILNLASNNIEVYSNLFTIDQISAIDMPESTETGIYCLASTGYSIEQNEFNGVDSSIDESEFPSGLGIRMVSSGPADNVIRNNDFSSLMIGIHAQKDNMNFDAKFQTGLQLLCNNFTLDKIDIYRDEQTTIRQDQGGNQPGGEVPVPAYNIFSEVIPDCTSHSDFLVSPNNIDYTNYFHNGQEIQIPNCVTNNGTFDMLSNALVPDVEDACSYSYSSNPHLHGTPGLITQHRAQIESLQADLNAKLLLYEQVVDKNQKINSLTEIETAYPEESEFVKNLLLQRYPLSDDVLKKLILHASKFQSWHLTEVFVANSPLDKKVLAELEQSEILSSFFMEFIYSANENPGATLKKMMELDILNKASQIDKLSFEYMKYIQNEYDFAVDSSNFEVPISDLYAECLMSSSEDHLKLQASLKSFQGLNADTEFEALNTPTESIAMKMMSLKSELDSTDINTLESFTLHNNDNVVSEAYQYLDFLNYSLATPPVQLPLQYRSLSTSGNSSKQRTKLPLMGATPNPSNQNCYIHYPIEADNHAFMSIIDLQGREIQNLTLNHNGLLNLNTIDFPDGIYLCKLISGNLVLDTIKITVIH